MEFFFRTPVPSVNECLSCAALTCTNCTKQELCQLCFNQFSMDEERGDAKRKTGQQADRMLEKSRRRFGEAEVGQTVLLAIPDVDKGRSEFPNLKCVVLEKSAGRMYR